MVRITGKNRWAVIAFWMSGWVPVSILVAIVGGCSTMRLPRIDPSGERIFLPAPAYTTPTISPPSLGNPFKPAFTRPTTPPACPPTWQSQTPAIAMPWSTDPCDLPVDPNACANLAPGLTSAPFTGGGVTGGRQLTLTPKRLVAPVGTEVVLKSGVRDPGGPFLSGREIQWLLSEESVGSFVEVGGESDPYWKRVLHQGYRKARKVSSNLAIGYTPCKSAVLSRGTTNPKDDVLLAKGETWISLTSASEGTSHVTAFTPAAPGWNDRRRSTTVYWIDAKWVLPTPVTAETGQAGTLTTIVSRQSDGSLLPGWIVRYESFDGRATFGPNQSPAVEITTDASGKATVEVMPASPTSGSTQVYVKIIRPADAVTRMPRLEAGCGITSVTWNAPKVANLAVQMNGPDVTEVGTSATYQIEVTNTGSRATEAVTVSAELPTGWSLENSSPAVEQYGHGLTWKTGSLQPGATEVFTATCLATVDATIGNNEFIVTATSGLITVTDRTTTRLFRSDLSVKISGPLSATEGTTVQYEITVKNLGSETLTNVVLEDVISQGLRHSRGTGRIELPIGDMAANASEVIPLEFFVDAPGELWHEVSVRADGGHHAKQRATINAAPRAPNYDFKATITGPTQRLVGELATFTAVIINTGDDVLTDLEAAIEYDLNMTPTGLSSELTPIGNVLAEPRHTTQTLTWSNIRLEPNQRVTIVLECSCDVAAVTACNRLTVTHAASGPRQPQEACLEIVSPVVIPDPIEDPGDTTPDVGPVIKRSGDLVLRTALNDTPIVDKTVDFYIVIDNDRPVDDKNVRLTLQWSSNLAFKSISRKTSQGPTILGGTNYTLEPTGVILAPIKAIRADETIEFTLVLTPKKIGTALITTNLTSAWLQSQTNVKLQNVGVDTQTTVLPAQQ